MDVENYINKANRQLSQKRYCKTLQDDRYNTVSWLMTQSAGLKKKTYFLKNWLRDRNSSIQEPLIFTFHRKIHKENNPGRPVINSVNCHISEISVFVDHHLQHLVREIPYK